MPLTIQLADSTLGLVPLLLDILRHGQALPTGPEGDRARPLSPEGARCLASLADRLAREGWRPNRVFTSPYERAVQSAWILARSAWQGAAVETLRELEPDAGPADVLRALTSRGIVTGRILIVGHQPLLGRLVGHLTGTEPALAPGTLIRVRCPRGTEPGNGTVVLTIAPAEAGGA